MVLLRFTGLILPVTELTSLPITRHVFVLLSAYNITTAKLGETDERVDMYLTLLFVAILCTLITPPSEIPVTTEIQDCSNLATSLIRSSEVWETEKMSHKTEQTRESNSYKKQGITRGQ
jgi:hypothetical protein